MYSIQGLNISRHKSHLFNSLCQSTILNHTVQKFPSPNSQFRKPDQVQSKHDRFSLTTVRAKSGLGDEDVDVAVFRFTLGIPGFDDRFLARIIGVAGIFALIVNHLSAGSNIDGAQMRTEGIVLILSALCIIAPTLESQLLELQPGKGRKEAAEQVAGSVNAFVIDDGLTNKQKQELAWASFALLKNTNSCSVFVIGENGKVIMVRGAVNSIISGQKGQDILKVLQSQLQNVDLKQGSQSLYLEDESSIQSSWLGRCKFVGKGIKCGVVEELQKGGFLIVLSDRNRAFQERDRKWITSISYKLKQFI